MFRISNDKNLFYFIVVQEYKENATNKTLFQFVKFEKYGFS